MYIIIEYFKNGFIFCYTQAQQTKGSDSTSTENDTLQSQRGQRNGSPKSFRLQDNDYFNIQVF
eukprot:m.126955 g.126955  ORF g.126955 m.126955 type:complete len:63 (-) comp14533_c0_seq3:24-212(-)